METEITQKLYSAMIENKEAVLTGVSSMKKLNYIKIAIYSR